MGVVLLLPNAKQQFEDGNGAPLAGGSVYMYVPNTSPPVFATTWQDINQIAANTNPIVLDADGRAIIWGDGVYRQVIYDGLGNLIWDELTSSPQNVNSLNFYDIASFMEAAPANAEVFPIYNIVRPLLLPQDLPGSIFTIATLPTSATVWTLRKNRTAIGTVSFATSGAPTVTFPNPISLAISDQLSWLAQPVADATAAGFAATLVSRLL